MTPDPSMATSQTQSPSEPSKISPNGEALTADAKYTNKQVRGRGLSSSSPQLEEVPIIYHYLTFETELPAPTSLGPAQNGSAAPQQPDLKNYVSPFTWSTPRKTFTTWLSCAVTVVTAYTAGSYSPPSQQMSEYWDVSQIAIYVGITTFTTGFAVAPMVLAPFSELNGRKPVFVATGILFVVCQLCCAVTRSYPGMLVARFFAGVGGSTFSTMVGGVVSDIYHTEGISQFSDVRDRVQSQENPKRRPCLTYIQTETHLWRFFQELHCLARAWALCVLDSSLSTYHGGGFFMYNS